MRTEKNKYFFKDDEEFYEFCVIPELEIKKSELGTLYTDFRFSDAYKNALEEGIRFVIEDEDSLIAKRCCISYRTITKPIENVETPL